MLLAISLPHVKALDFKWGYLPFICAFSTVLFSDPLLSSLKPVAVTLVSMEQLLQKLFTLWVRSV